MTTRSVYSSVPTECGDVILKVESAEHQLASEEGLQELVRKWTFFPGKNKFYCDGRIITGKSQSLFYFACILIVITNVLFLAFEWVLTF